MKPIFENECEFCMYLGTFNGNDLYWCKSYNMLVARFGENIGHEVSRSVENLLNKPTYYYLYVANLMAKDKGYI